MKIYTKTGDAGETGLFGGARVSKDDTRVEAYGDVDELNSVIGVVLTHTAALSSLAQVSAELRRIQSELFDLGAELARDPSKDPHPSSPRIDNEAIARLERAIDEQTSELPALATFILPGGSAPSAALHVARTVCRRAERRVVSLGHVSEVRPVDLRYLNRLSDLLFVFARTCNHRLDIDDVPWLGMDRR